MKVGLLNAGFTGLKGRSRSGAWFQIELALLPENRRILTICSDNQGFYPEDVNQSVHVDIRKLNAKTLNGGTRVIFGKNIQKSRLQ